MVETKHRQDKIDATKKALKAVVDIKVAALSRAATSARWTTRWSSNPALAGQVATRTIDSGRFAPLIFACLGARELIVGNF